jgi:hypothetical protein
MFTQDEEDYLKGFVASQKANEVVEQARIDKEEAIRVAELTREQALTDFNAKQDADYQKTIKPLDDAIEQLKK